MAQARAARRVARPVVRGVFWRELALVLVCVEIAIFILAYGISNIAATVGYEIAILDYDLSIMPVWGPLLGFAIGAPLLFVARTAAQTFGT